MSLIWLVLKRSSVEPLPRTVPACSKYPTPEEKSTTFATGTSVLTVGRADCATATPIGVDAIRSEASNRLTTDISGLGG